MGGPSLKERSRTNYWPSKHRSNISAECFEINIRFASILSTEFKEIATVGSFRLSSELTILHSIYHMRKKYANTTAGITPTLQVKGCAVICNSMQ